MRICLATSGTRGDVFPFLALGRELASRGHEAWVLTHPYFESDVRAGGLGFESFGAGFDLGAMLQHPDLFHHRRGQPLVFRWVRESIGPGVADFRAMFARRRPDVVVYHHFLIGGPQACAEAGVPCVHACLAPCAWLSRDDPAPAPQMRTGALAGVAGRMLAGVARPILTLLTDRLYRPELRAAGLDPGKRVFVEACRGGALNLGLWSRHFRPPCADDPPTGVITGFCLYDGPGSDLGWISEDALEPGLRCFLDEGEAPVVFAMGSAAHHTAGPFYEWAAGACRTLGVRGVLLTGSAEAAPRDLPPGVAAFGYAPFGALFPRARLTVQHGGIGSVAQALRAGHPTLVAARAHDQFNNGVHVHRLGVGRMLPLHRMTPCRLTRTLAAMLHDRPMVEASEILGARLQTEDGPRVAADHIEAFATA